MSEQLRERRTHLGLSLSDVARRAGTSAATLSRYENGWTRFETYTLRKLATALGCELDIRLRPKALRNPRATSRSEAAAKLKRLFWDHELTPEDFATHTVWLVERVLDYGSLEDVNLLIQTMGRDSFLRLVAKAERLSPRTRAFWHQILEMEGTPCTKKYSRNAAWIS